MLSELQYRLQLSGPGPDIPKLRRDAVEAVAAQELAARRFKNAVSAENSIEDACSRRLNGIGIATFDQLVEEWLRGRPDALSTALMAKATTDKQRQRIAELLGSQDFQPATPLAQDLEPPPPGRVKTTTSRIIRDSSLSSREKALHNYECQIFGYTLTLADGSRYAEGHHVRPLGSPHDGGDVLGNILCLCPNHHAACDLGAIELVLADLRPAVGHAVDQRYIDYHNTENYPGKARCENRPALGE